MGQPERTTVELPRIKRITTSWEGLVIEYLLNHPSKKRATTLVMEAITAYWLAESLEGKVLSSEIYKACREAAKNLLEKVNITQEIGEMNIRETSSVNKELADTSQPKSELEKDDDDDDWQLELVIPQEYVEINNALRID